MAEFHFPGVYIGCPVRISTDPSESNTTLGWVFKVGNESAAVISIDGVARFDCWHADDPRCMTESNVFQQFDDRGVFRLTDGEIQRRQLYDRMSTLEGRLAEVILEMRETAGKQPTSKPQSHVQPSLLPQIQPKRKRGRPRKTEHLREGQPVEI